MSQSQTLEPLSPEDGLEMYMEARRDELADGTLKSQRYRIRAFVQWCEEEEIRDMSQDKSSAYASAELGSEPRGDRR